MDVDAPAVNNVVILILLMFDDSYFCSYSLLFTVEQNENLHKPHSVEVNCLLNFFILCIVWS